MDPQVIDIPSPISSSGHEADFHPISELSFSKFLLTFNKKKYRVCLPVFTNEKNTQALLHSSYKVFIFPLLLDRSVKLKDENLFHCFSKLVLKVALSSSLR